MTRKVCEIANILNIAALYLCTWHFVSGFYLKERLVCIETCKSMRLF